MNGKEQILKRFILIFPAIALGIYLISVVQFGCRLDTNLPDNAIQKPFIKSTNDQAEDSTVRTTTPLPSQEPNETPVLTEQANQIEQVPEKTDTIISLLPEIAKQNEPLALVTVSSNEQWLLTAAAPIAAKIRQLNKTPILLALTSEPVPEQTRLLKRLEPFIGSCTMVASDPNLYISQIRGNCLKNTIPVTAEPSEVGLFLAKSFWGKTDMVVMAVIEDSEAMILGSTLASHLVVPFIPIIGDEDPNVLSRELKVLSTRRVYFITSERGLTSINIPEQKIEILDTPTVQQQLVDTIGSANMQNIILFRVPDEFTESGDSCWLAPYLSLMRGAPLIPCYSSDPLTAEENAEAFTKTYSLKPRTATLLADYDSINMISATYTTELDDYELLLEPCSRPKEGMAVEMGVGRIPFVELWASSTLIARNIAKEYILGPKKPKTLMIANPSTEYGPLPLCETVSRATAREFKNFGVHIDEFYGTSLYDPAIRNSILDSQLIIFEGHITDFTLFEDPSVYSDEQYYASEWQENSRDGFIEVTDLLYDQTEDSTDYNFADNNVASVSSNVQFPNEPVDPNCELAEVNSQPFSNQIPQAMDPCQLDGVPLMILQSCHSLDDSVLNILASGTVGVVGSVTNIHSASGSAFIKAFCDGLLYRPETIGEAMRDARNYLLCVSALKTERGHTQQAKVNRVAYGFHLWGDPEARLFSSLPKRPKRQAVSATFIAPDKIHIVTPKKRLPTSRTKEYFLRMFPGDQVAGIVKRLKNKDIRRVAPLYFFRIPMPKGFDPLRYTALKGPDETSDRAVFLTDPFGRFLYILYFPEKDKKEQELILQFVN